MTYRPVPVHASDDHDITVLEVDPGIDGDVVQLYSHHPVPGRTDITMDRPDVLAAVLRDGERVVDLHDVEVHTASDGALEGWVGGFDGVAYTRAHTSNPTHLRDEARALLAIADQLDRDAQLDQAEIAALAGILSGYRTGRPDEFSPVDVVTARALVRAGYRRTQTG